MLYHSVHDKGCEKAKQANLTALQSLDKSADLEQFLQSAPKAHQRLLLASPDRQFF